MDRLIRLRVPHRAEWLPSVGPGGAEETPVGANAADLARAPAPGLADAGQLEKINALPQVLRPLTAEDVIVRGMRLFNTLPMHNGLRFMRESLAEALPLIVGKPVLVNHTTDESGIEGLPVGRFFDARMVPLDGGEAAIDAWFYMLADELGQALAARIDAGVIGEVSPTVLYERSICSICGADDMYYECENGHRMGEEYNGETCYCLLMGVTDVLEGSIVWAGMQRETRFLLAAGRSVEVVDAEELAACSRAERERAADDPWRFMAMRRDDWSAFDVAK